MFDNIIKEIEKVKKNKKSQKKKVGIIFSITTHPKSNEFKIFPIRSFENFIFLPISIKNGKNAILLTKKIDGLVDYIVFDSENKIKSCQNLFEKIYQTCKKSQIFPVKGNDFTSDSAYALIITNLNSLRNKKICILGAGNIGSKVALKLIETGIDVFIINSNKKSSIKVANSINVLKPKECLNKAIPITVQDLVKVDCIIGFTRGVSVIDKTVISFLKRNGLIIDGGGNNISPDAIKEIQRKKLKMFKLDIRYGFESNFRLIKNTKELNTRISGEKEIGKIKIVAGGIIGKKGDVVVDNIISPKRIIGIADGLGGILENTADYMIRIKKIEKNIKNKNYD